MDPDKMLPLAYSFKISRQLEVYRLEYEKLNAKESDSEKSSNDMNGEERTNMTINGIGFGTTTITMKPLRGVFRNIVAVLVVSFVTLACQTDGIHPLFVPLLVGCVVWACYVVTLPSPPRVCGSPGGPLITATRVKLRDGRHLAYKEHGVPIHQANHAFIFVHGFDSCRHHAVIATTLSTEIMESLGIHIVSFDRPGYGESDPDPKQSLKSIAMDIEELGDQLQLGPKFYVVGLSIGAQLVWGCLKYIPHRLAGATLLTPVVNYWWRGLPADLCEKAYKKQPKQDQWAVRVAHHAPWLTYWWNTRSWIPPSSAVARNPNVMSRQDKQLLSLRKPSEEAILAQGEVRQQGVHESLHRALRIGFGEWEFDPTDLSNPFPEGQGSVHLWQGGDDMVVPAELQRWIARKLPWIQYHELPGAGHLFPLAQGMADAIIKAQLSINS